MGWPLNRKATTAFRPPPSVSCTQQHLFLGQSLGRRTGKPLFGEREKSQITCKDEVSKAKIIFVVVFLRRGRVFQGTLNQFTLISEIFWPNDTGLEDLFCYCTAFTQFQILFILFFFRKRMGKYVLGQKCFHINLPCSSSSCQLFLFMGRKMLYQDLSRHRSKWGSLLHAKPSARTR